MELLSLIKLQISEHISKMADSDNISKINSKINIKSHYETEYNI